MEFDASHDLQYCSENWLTQPLIKCTSDENISYGIVQPGQHDENGIPVVRINNFKNDGLDLNDVLKVAQSIEAKYERTRLQGGEVLLTLVGTTGLSLIAPDSLKGWNVPRAIAVIRAKEEIGNKWINLCLQTAEVKNFLDARANTTVQKTLNLKDVREIPISLPPKRIKDFIEKVAYDLTDKISINNQINQTLEEMAQAIFKSWFMDFDPVKAKAQIIAQGGSEQDANLAAMEVISGKTRDQLAALQKTHPEHYTQLHTTATLFPSAFEESELGEIPEGWGAGNVGHIAEAKGGYAFKSSHFQSSGNPVVKIKNITGNGDVDIENTECVSDEIANIAEKFLLSDGDLVMAMTGATIGKTGLIQTNGKKALLNQRVAKFFSSEHGNRISWFLFCLFKLESAAEFIIGTAQGSAQPNISSTGIESTPAVIPPHSLIKAFIERANPFFEMWLHNQIQIKALSTTRDILLPKLLSGEIDVSQLNLEA